MDLLFTISILGFWIIFNVVLYLNNKKKPDYNFIVCLLFVAGFGYFWLSDYMETVYYYYFQYGLLIVFILHIGYVAIKNYFKGDVSEFDVYKLEEELDMIKNASEMLRRRFISTIEIMYDGIYFIDDDNTIFGSDKFVEIFGLNNNQITVQKLETLLHPDDVHEYHKTIEKTTKKNPLYKISYRIKKSGDYIWIKETGKKVYLDNKFSIVATIKLVDVKQFPETEIDVLNHIPTYKNLYAELQQLLKRNIPFYFIEIDLTNIPNLNDKYGRDVGDLMMGEYLKKLRFNFIKDSKSLYRISGIKFGLIITDERKYEVLKRALIYGGDLLNLKMVLVELQKHFIRILE